MKNISIWWNKFYYFLTEDKNSAILWLLLRVYVGWEWLYAGYEKIISEAWVGFNAGGAVTGFLNGALAKAYAVTPHHDVMMWYAWFIKNIALPNASLFSHLVTFGEIFVGLGLILGLFTTTAAFFGSVMNFSYLFAGTVSSNPWLLLLQILIISGRKVSGWIGLDRFIKKV